MRKHLALAALTCLLATTAHAQTNTATGVGVGTSTSNSAAGAVAIGGGQANAQGGRGGQGGSSASSLNINNAAQPTTTTQNINTSGTSTVRTVPTTVPPALAAAGIETCLGSASAGASVAGFGLSGGSTYKDYDCSARLDARTLYSMGLKAAAIARLCQTGEIWRSMPDICSRYTPRVQAAGVVVASTADAYASVTPGAIELTEGRTGRVRMCDRYDATAQRCRQWQGTPSHPQMVAGMVVHHAPVHHVAPKVEVPSTSRSLTAVKPEPVKAEPAKVDPPKAEEPKKDN